MHSKTPRYFLPLVVLHVAAVVCLYLNRSPYGGGIYTKMHRDVALAPSRNALPLHSSPSYGYTDLPEWLQDYVKFHRESLDVDKTTGEARLKHGVRFLVFYCRTSCGGIGDRIKGILSLFYTAMCTNRVFLIDSDIPFPLQDYLEPHLIQWNVSYPEETNTTKALMYKNLPTQELWRTVIEAPIGIRVRSNYWKFGSKDFLEESRRLAKDWKHRGGANILDKLAAVENATNQPLFQMAFWTLFRFSERVLRRAEQLKISSGLRWKYDPYIAIHIRTGQGTTWIDPERHVGEETYHQFLSCAHSFQKKLMSCMDMKRPDIFIPSDNVTVKTLIQSWDSASVRVAKDLEVFHADRTSIHKAKNASLAFLDIWAELVVLMDSECIIKSRSGFGRLAHLLPVSANKQHPRCAVDFYNCTNDMVNEVVEKSLGGCRQIK